MLKTMKTAQELGFEDWEYKGLIEVRDMLIDGKIHKNTSHSFNMNVACEVEGCGTVACIGGWVGLLHGLTVLEVSEYVHSNSPLDQVLPENPILAKLYYPPEDEDIEWSAITPEQAAQAINNVLYNGDPDWRSALQLEPVVVS